MDDIWNVTNELLLCFVVAQLLTDDPLHDGFLFFGIQKILIFLQYMDKKGDMNEYLDGFRECVKWKQHICCILVWSQSNTDIESQ